MYSFRFFSLLVLLFLWLGSLPALRASFGQPEGFLADESINETLIYPGVVWYEVTGRDGGQPQVVHIVRVDIAEPHLSMKSLLGERFVSEASGQFFRRSHVSHLQEDNDSLVAINTAFFEISNTQAPRGVILQDGKIYKQPEPGRFSFLSTADGIPYIGNFSFTGMVRHAGSSRPLVGINPYSLTGAQLGLYRQPWDRSPGSTGSFSGIDKTEVVVEILEEIAADSPEGLSRIRGRVVEVRDRESPVVIADGHIVLSGAGTSRALLLPMEPGDIVETEWRLQGSSIADLNWNEVVEASPGTSLLVVDGERRSSSLMNVDHWNNRHPRSAIGIRADQTQLLLMLVEGRQTGRAAGMSLHRVGEYMQHLGALNALEFDGGGSSSMVAKVNGAPRRLNTPSDGSERYVPAGLGVQLVAEPENTFFQNIRISGDAELAVISWETARPSVSRLKYGRASLDHFSPDNRQRVTRHSATIQALEQGKNHYGRLVAETATGRETSPLLTIPFAAVDEVIVDDSGASFQGTWNSGSFGTPWAGGYRWANTVTGEATHTASFVPNLTIAGYYDVYSWYVPGTNRSGDARYQILHADGVEEVRIDQRTQGEQWQLLAEDLRFEAGSSASVTIDNQSAESGLAVMADAVRWVLRNADSGGDESVPHWWLTHYFGEDLPELEQDVDGDGNTVKEEFIWGTDPTNSQSRVRKQLEYAGDGQWYLAFSPYLPNRNYQLWSRNTFDASDWVLTDMVAHSDIKASRGYFELDLETPYERRFFQIRANLIGEE